MPSLAFLALAPSLAPAQPTNATSTIDLPTALKLAGAQSLDVQIARERLVEARANQSSALAQFFPWISPGIVYRQHDEKLQDVEGNILDVNKYSYAPGAALAAQVDVGDALYKSLAAKRLTAAAGHGLEAQRQDTVLAAAQGYFDLAQAQASVGVAREARSIAADYEQEIKQAVDAGIAFKGDALRVTVQKERRELTLRQTLDQQRVAAARLAQVLHLDPVIDLVPQDADLVPLTLIETNAALDALVQQTLASRPELKQNRSLIAAARDSSHGATYGPIIPTIGASAFFGGLGGGRSGISDSFGAQEDYLVSLSWRIGPGGLFDSSRIHASESRLRTAELTLTKLQDDLIRQVVEAFTHWQSLRDQLATVSRALAAAEEGLRLARQRKEYAVGIVLENIQAEDDLTSARLEYLRVAAEFNRAQYTLRKVTGQL